MGKSGTFFLGILIPVLTFVAIVRGVMDGMNAVLTWWTLGYTVGIALVVTVIEAKLSAKPKKKPFGRENS